MSPTVASIWPRPSAKEARDKVLDQHGAIRTLLWGAASVARAAASGRTDGQAKLLGHVTAIRQALEEHIACEEQLLIPIFEDDLPVGPIRARLVAQEHARQRAELLELDAVGRAGDFVRLAEELACFTSNVLIDMEHEEKTFLREEALRDDAGVVSRRVG